jgi:toxin ParE1/3/4
MRVKKTQVAAAAERHIIARLYADSPTAAAKLAARLDTATALLGRFPHLGRPGQRPGTRELVVAGTPYIIEYRLLARSVEILDVRHSGRPS